MNAFLTSQNFIDTFKKEIDTCCIHADRIQRALGEITPFLPLTIEKIQNMNTHELAITELLVGRFAKLQDTIGEKIFPRLLTLLGEDVVGKSFIDRLNMLEKIGYLESVEIWATYRAARNAVAHEYPDTNEIVTQNLTNIINLSKELLVYWVSLHQKIQMILK